MVGASASVVSVARAVAPAVAGALHDVHYNAGTALGLGLAIAGLALAAAVTRSKHARHLNDA